MATYGQVAELAGLAGHARQVGYALAGLHESDVEDVPWQRVINTKGEISPRAIPGADEFQRVLLEDEGIEFDLRGRISLTKYRWKSPAKRPTPTPGSRERQAR